MKAVVAAFNQEKALVGAFSVITNLRMELFEALVQYSTVLTWLLHAEEGLVRAQLGHVQTLELWDGRLPHGAAVFLSTVTIYKHM